MTEISQLMLDETSQMGTRQYKTRAVFGDGGGPASSAWLIALAVARWMQGNGYVARACQGPALTSPDDEPTVHCAHVQAPAEAWRAFKARTRDGCPR